MLLCNNLVVVDVLCLLPSAIVAGLPPCLQPHVWLLASVLRHVLPAAHL